MLKEPDDVTAKRKRLSETLRVLQQAHKVGSSSFKLLLLTFLVILKLIIHQELALNYHSIIFIIFWVTRHWTIYHLKLKMLRRDIVWNPTGPPKINELPPFYATANDLCSSYALLPGILDLRGRLIQESNLHHYIANSVANGLGSYPSVNG